MTEIVVIADDLTGAADTGVQFCPYFTNTILTSYDNLSRNFDILTSQALAIYTNSRSMKAESAQKRVRLVAQQLRAFQPKQIYKKVDSCLRGNLGAEVDEIVDEMGFELSFIAPAFPEMGRVTVHNVHLVHDIPIADTELSLDPVNPVRQSQLSGIVASQSRYKVGHVDMQFLEGDDEAMGSKIARLAEAGARHVVFDATCQAHLDKITRFALSSNKRILLVGSAGLAGSLGTHFQKADVEAEDEIKDLGKGYHLLVCGTTSDVMRLQIVTLVKTYLYQVISLMPSLLADSKGRDNLSLKASLAQRLLSENNLIIKIGSSETAEAAKISSAWTPEQIVQGLGLLVATVLKGKRPASLFLSGGDTASAVLTAIGAKGIQLRREIVPGVPKGTIIGDLMDGLPVVTKAGAFGGDDTLIAVHEYWLKKGKEKSV
ncbi:MAG: four-carbon acid sugar kinase family protein [Deltaproteobacteria bacterium]|nr:MAG: four-carbon acid sugar kinase family protein [Deltaproteobacteria bacterium]